MEILRHESGPHGLLWWRTMGLPTAFALHLRNNSVWPPCNTNMIACDDDEGENVRLTLADWNPVPWDGKHWAYNAGRQRSTAPSPASRFLNLPRSEVEMSSSKEKPSQFQT